MKKFIFSLERLLRLNEQQLQKEKTRMSQIMEEKNSCENRKKMVEEQLGQIHAAMDLEIRKGTTIYQIRVFTATIENGKKQVKGLKEKLAVLDMEIERQREIVVRASQEVKKLEKLREKQLEEYRRAEAKEQELNVSEHVAGKYIRQGVS